MRGWNIGIIGGGPGGLMTAYSLQKYFDFPVKITLFEADSRLGGKVWTKKFKNLPAHYEAGAAELYDYSPVDEDPLKNLIKELGLPIQPMGGSSVIINNRILSNLDDIGRELGSDARQNLVLFDRLARDAINPRDFYSSDHPDRVGDTSGLAASEPRFSSTLSQMTNPAARNYIHHLIHSDLATEPEKTSIAYGLQNYLMNHPAYLKLYSIEGGNERLIHELVRRIEATVLLRHCVTEIRQVSRPTKSNENGLPKSLRVTSTSQGAVREEDFDFVILSLPHNCLSTLHFPDPDLALAMQRHHNQYNHPAHYLRISILFAKPFWRDYLTDSYWMLDQFGGCCLYDESARTPGATHGVLGWLLAGDPALELAGLSDANLVAKALDSLPSFLANSREHLLEASVHRWIGAVNAIPGGVCQQPLEKRHQPEPQNNPNLFVVGDYLFDSTLNGLLDSADFVSQWLVSLMTEKTAKSKTARFRAKVNA